MKTTLNHLNLSVPDARSFSQFLMTAFGFHVLNERGNGNFIVLAGEDGFILALLQNPSIHEYSYPQWFHFGFLQDSTADVDEAFQRIQKLGIAVEGPSQLRKTAYGFYLNAPGGVLMEVSAYHSA